MPERSASRLQLAQQFLSYVGKSDVTPALDLLSPSAIYEVPGSHALAGTFSTPTEIVSHMLALAEKSGGTLEATKWEDWLVGELHVACLARIQLQAEGKLYAGRQVFLLAFDRNDLIERINIFFDDPAAADRFFNT